MHLADFLDPSAIRFNLHGNNREEVLAELVQLLRLEDRAAQSLLALVERRERMGSTGFGRGIAIPHARSLVVSRLRVAFGTKPSGIPYNAVDDEPAKVFFLIVAPPREVSNQYLPVLGKVAQLCQQPEVPRLLTRLRNPDELLALLKSHGV